MVIDWTTIIVTLLGGGGLLSIYSFIKYRRQNNTIKTAEAKSATEKAEQDELETQKSQVDLGQQVMSFVSESLNTMQTRLIELNKLSSDDQLKKMDQLSQQMTTIQTSFNAVLANQETMRNQLKEIETRTVENELWVHFISMLLNGDLKELVRAHKEEFEAHGINLSKYLGEETESTD